MAKVLGATRQTMETAPPRIIKVDRRPSFDLRLETIQEETDGNSRKDGSSGLESTSKMDFKRRPSLSTK
ncbi:hypothetical protein AMTR_s00040p00164100 [Amborella trichopoda]|uniref:Uncharacterized protein n=1 Tax=Amborella trichopoda TaxID=13333 RepID=W1PYN6_AMBTC|nr:hypothetical protein AMTR_s00040p00164100 [Amborella trichopoda]